MKELRRFDSISDGAVIEIKKRTDEYPYSTPSTKTLVEYEKIKKALY